MSCSQHTRRGDSGDFSLQKQKRIQKRREISWETCCKQAKSRGHPVFALNRKEAHEHAGGRAPATERDGTEPGGREEETSNSSMRGREAPCWQFPNKQDSKTLEAAEFGGPGIGQNSGTLQQPLRCHQCGTQPFPGRLCKASCCRPPGN